MKKSKLLLIPLFLLIFIFSCLYIVRELYEKGEQEDHHEIVLKNKELEYKEKERILNDRLTNLEETCQTLLKENDSLKVSSAVKEEKRKKVIKPAWDNKLAEAKQDQDTVDINQLDSIHGQEVATCDSIIDDKNQQIENLEEVHQVDQEKLAVKNQENEINEQRLADEKANVDHEKKKNRKLERKIKVLKVVNGTLFVIGLTIAIVSLM